MTNEKTKAILYGMLVTIVIFLFMVFVPVKAVDAVDGAVIYSAYYAQKIDYDGFFFSNIDRYSELSAQKTTSTTLYRIERTGTSVLFSGNYTFNGPYGRNITIYDGDNYDTTLESGWINATVAYHYANGTETQITYTKFYPAFPTPTDTINFTVELQSGDTAFTTVYQANSTNNITRLQIVKVSGMGLVEIIKYPSLENIMNGLNTVISTETTIVTNSAIFIDIGFKIFIIIGVPFGIVLFLLWGARKMKEAFRELLR